MTLRAIQTGSVHPYHRQEVTFRLEREEEVGPQLPFREVNSERHAGGWAACADIFRIAGRVGLIPRRSISLRNHSLADARSCIGHAPDRACVGDRR